MSIEQVTAKAMTELTEVLKNGFQECFQNLHEHSRKCVTVDSCKEVSCKKMYDYIFLCNNIIPGTSAVYIIIVMLLYARAHVRISS
jgi:hypothetical protein